MRKMDFLKRHKFLVFVLLLVIIITGINCVKRYQKNRMMEAALLTGIEVQNYDDYIKGLKDHASDIAGMSQYDKLEMGLDYRDGSDTDFDGLTDKEEIEIYGTDPLQASTAGDLYSDGYKIEHEMDLFSFCEYDGEINFKYNECSEVTLKADEPTDFYAVVQDYTDRYSLADFGINTVYKGYWIYNYNGEVQIDLTSVCDEYGIGFSDIRVWVYKGDFLAYGLSSLKKCNYNADGNVITLKYDFEDTSAYYVYITGKRSLAALFLNTPSMQVNESSDSSGIAFVCGSPILEQFFSISGHIYYSELSDKEKNNSFLEKVVDYCNNKVLGSEIGTDDENKITATSSLSVKLTAQLYQTLLPMCAAKPEGEETFFNYLFNYTIYEAGGTEMASGSSSAENNEEDDERDHYHNYHTTFDPYTDELPFQNFESKYGTAGNCTGIASLTALLFNTGTFPASGDYQGVSWDLTTDSENNTLMDAGLYDYKSREFVNNHSGKYDNYLGEGLSDGETEFVKMIGALWMESNDKLPYLDDYVMTDGRTNDWSLAEKMMDYLDQGKILSVGLLLKNGTGHEVNIYDYYFTDAGELLFRVYDCNFPQNDLKNVELNCGGACYLQCKKIIREDGTSAFTYLYYPVKGDMGYMASSNISLMEENAIVVADEYWNAFN